MYNFFINLVIAFIVMQTIHLKRVYEKPSPEDGYRVLVDRIWPRGISKQEADIAEWDKDLAPSLQS